MRDRILDRIARISIRYPGRILMAALLLTVIMGLLASRLELTIRWADLMPRDNPMVVEFDRILNEYSSTSNIILVIEGDYGEMTRFADEIAPAIEALDPYIRNVTYRTDESFIRRHGLMLLDRDDLKDMADLTSDPALLPFITRINDNFEEGYIEDEKSLGTGEKEKGVIRHLDGLEFWLDSMKTYTADGDGADPSLATRSAERLLMGDTYLSSWDRKMMLLIARPTFSITDTPVCTAAVDSIEKIIEAHLDDYPSLTAGLTGSVTLARDEFRAASGDMYFTTIVALVLIVVLFIIAFRMWIAPVFAGIALVTGIVWAAGIAALTVGSLNLMTSMFAVILAGLGVDFSIHIIAIYSELRSAGSAVSDAIRGTLERSGAGIVTGALTTAVAFFTIMISDSRGMKEMGFIAGEGVIMCMLVSIIVLPAMLVLHERIVEKVLKRPLSVRPGPLPLLGKAGSAVSGHPFVSIIVLVVVTGFMIFNALHIEWDYNLMNMEPKGLKSVILQDRMIEKFGISPDFALVTASSVDESRRIAGEAKKLNIVGAVDNIADFIPSREQQEIRTGLLEEIRRNVGKNGHAAPLAPEDLDAFTLQLKRLEDNIIELGQLAYMGGKDRVDRKCASMVGGPPEGRDPSIQGRPSIDRLCDSIERSPFRAIRSLNRFQEDFVPEMRRLVYRMSDPGPISLETLPDEIRSRYLGNSGKDFLVTVYPREQVWNFEFLRAFEEQVKMIDSRFTGTPLLFLAMYEIVGRDGRQATALAVVLIFLMLLLDFRRVGLAVMAMIPLFCGTIWMLGMLHCGGLMLTFISIMGLPLIIGMGIDDGVHILHRYRVEGRGKIPAIISSTGKAILLTSLTTMLAFGSLKFATYRGFGSLGLLLFIGVGACFLTSITVLPALLGLMEKK